MKSLLASHGSVGAVAAENAAVSHCAWGDALDHLYVIPSWWAQMTGDDWLNNGISRNRYRDYLQYELIKESQDVIERVSKKCQQKNIRYHSIVVVGETNHTLYQHSKNRDYATVFIGSHRPKGTAGIRDRMLTKKILSSLGNKLAVIDHPHG